MIATFLSKFNLNKAGSLKYDSRSNFSNYYPKSYILAELTILSAICNDNSKNFSIPVKIIACS